MAQKRKKAVSRGKKAAAPRHSVPQGFWSQVWAVFLMAFAILFVIGWFKAGGPVVEWLNDAGMRTIGYAVYVLPIVLAYISIEIFRAENNKTPFVTKAAAVLLVLWFAGMFGVMRGQGQPSTGGVVGDGLNSVMLSLVDNPVAIFLYVLLIGVTLLFLMSISPALLISKIAAAFQHDNTDEAKNVKVMRRAAEADTSERKSVRGLLKRATGKDDEDSEAKDTPAKKGAMSDFKLNMGVPTLGAEDVTEKDKPKTTLSSLRSAAPKPADKAAQEKTALVMANDPNWQAPSLDLLETKQNPADAGDIEQNAQIIQDTFHEFDINVKMEGANIGPKVTQYTLSPPSGVKLTRITALETNLALNLAAQSLRMEAPIPGQKAVGIEVPNIRAADVRLYGILSSPEWSKSSEPLSFALGKDIAGTPTVGALNKMPHLLIAGQTGSGKSVMINTLLTSLLYRNSPSDMKLILVDPKQVEMAAYDDIPHLLTPVISEPEKTVSALKWAVNEMERRYKVMREEKVRDIVVYNQRLKQRGKHISVADENGNMQQVNDGKMPYIVIVIDELADLMQIAARDVEGLIVRLAQKSRAVGIHLVLATQRPSVNVITGLIKANVPARIAFTVASQVDSRTILDQGGADKLLGQGDMLFKTASMGKPKRIQGAWVMDEEVMKITDHLRAQSTPQYNDEIISQQVQLGGGKGGVNMDGDSESGDGMFMDAVEVVVSAQKASTSLLQRKLRIGYGRAARIIEEMEEKGIIGPQDGSRPREVLVSSMDDLNGPSAEEASGETVIEVERG